MKVALTVPEHSLTLFLRVALLVIAGPVSSLAQVGLLMWSRAVFISVPPAGWRRVGARLFRRNGAAISHDGIDEY